MSTNKKIIQTLFSVQGKVSRRTFAFTGFILFALKYNLDRLIALQYGKAWFITDYFMQADHVAVEHIGAQDLNFYLALLTFAIPFIWIGTLLCLKRLRDVTLPLWLVIFFFLPLLNLFFFLLLCILPGKTSDNQVEVKPPFLKKLIPTGKTGSIIFSIGITITLAILFSLVSINLLHEYGWGLFIAIPFFIGFCSVLLYSYHHQPISKRQAIGIGVTSIAFFAVFLFALAMEGVICIAMAAPFGFIVGIMGALLGYAIQFQPPKASLNSITGYVLLLPLVMWYEKEANSEAPVYELKTSVVINQPPQIVWEHLVNFSSIQPPKEFIFRTGIAYPVDAKITGKGKGAIRKCNFTTGSFIEPITTWDEPHLLQFDVLQQPPPMIEMSIYDHIDAPHLEGYFKSQHGQFKLTEMNGHKTLLEGTTWYVNEMWPLAYWKIWSDYILHKIHYRVLKHIKQEAEGQPNQADVKSY